jgi:hypothetical protein
MTSFSNEFRPVSGNIISDGFSTKVQTDLSTHHILSAALYARLCAKIEKAFDPTMMYSEEFGELLTEHRAHVISSIFASVAFLEATINKFFADEIDHLEETINMLFAKAVDQTNSIIRNLLDYSTTKLVIADFLRRAMSEKDRDPIWKKFDDTLTSAGKESFNKGVSPYQDIVLLVNLRNALIHYKPKWVTVLSENQIVDEVDDAKIDALQKQHKFPLNPLTEGFFTSFFPDRCLSHGCAKWAVNSSIKFVEEFYQRIGLPSSFDLIRSRLKTEP